MMRVRFGLALLLDELCVQVVKLQADRIAGARFGFSHSALEPLVMVGREPRFHLGPHPRAQHLRHGELMAAFRTCNQRFTHAVDHRTLYACDDELASLRLPADTVWSSQ